MGKMLMESCNICGKTVFSVFLSLMEQPNVVMGFAMSDIDLLQLALWLLRSLWLACFQLQFIYPSWRCVFYFQDVVMV